MLIVCLGPDTAPSDRAGNRHIFQHHVRSLAAHLASLDRGLAVAADLAEPVGKQLPGTDMAKTVKDTMMLFSILARTSRILFCMLQMEDYAGCRFLQM